MRPLLAAFRLFALTGAATFVAVALVLGPGLDRFGERLSGGARRALGIAVASLALVAGLVAYFVLLARALRALGLPPDRVTFHLLTTAVVPPVLLVAALWIWISRMRIGW